MADHFQCGEFGHAVDKNGSCTLCDFRLSERERVIVDAAESAGSSRAHNEPLIALADVPPSELLSASESASASAYGKSAAKENNPEASNEADMALPQTAQTMVDRVLAGPRLARAERDATLALKSDMLLAIDGLLADWLDGNDPEFVDAEVRPPGADAPPVARAVHHFAYIVSGLWRGDAQIRPMMLSREWVARWLSDTRMAEVCGLKRRVTGRTVGNALELLCRTGALAKVGEAKVPGKPRPGFLYELVPVEHADDRVDELGRPEADDPDVHAVDEPLMPRAVAAVVDGPLDAAESGTGNGADGVLHPSIMPHEAVASASLNAIGGPL